MSIFLILHDIRSAENVGSMFRTADAFAVTKIFLTGYTPAPIDRFKRPVSKIAKTALGAEKSVPWEKENITEIISDLKARDVRIVALEQDARSVALGTHYADADVALIVGNEVEGLQEEVLDMCDSIVEIPMLGTKESLNVAVSAGVALFQYTRNQ